MDCPIATSHTSAGCASAPGAPVTACERVASSGIRIIGRATQGVRLIDIEGDDRAVSIARLAEREEEERDLEDKPEPQAGAETEAPDAELNGEPDREQDGE